MLEFLVKLSWQDWVLGVGQIFFFVALIPSIRSKKDKPALMTSVMTGSILIAFAITFATLSLWFGMGSVILAALGWYILAFQKLCTKD